MLLPSEKNLLQVEIIKDSGVSIEYRHVFCASFSVRGLSMVVVNEKNVVNWVELKDLPDELSIRIRKEG